jgi:hypothetical protein
MATGEVMKNLSSAFQDRREKAKPHEDLHKIGLQCSYLVMSGRFAAIQAW